MQGSTKSNRRIKMALNTLDISVDDMTHKDIVIMDNVVQHVFDGCGELLSKLNGGEE